MDRRLFLKMMAAASSAVAVASCGKNPSEAIPYLVPPEDDIRPGVPVYTRTVCTECPAGCGMSVKSYDKVIHRRHTLTPVKLDGNPDHPLNQGKLCARGQASLQRLYSPDRIVSPRKKSGSGWEPVSWEEAFTIISDQLAEDRQNNRVSLLLTGPGSGSLRTLKHAFCQAAGIMFLPEYDPVPYGAVRHASRLLFGLDILPSYRFDLADFVLTLSADVVETFGCPVAHARRLFNSTTLGTRRWVHLEPHVSLTGLSAGERHVIRPGTEPLLLRFLLQEIMKNPLAPPRLNHLLAGRNWAMPPVMEHHVIAETGLADPAGIAQALTLADAPLIVAGTLSTSGPGARETALLTGVIQWLTGMIGTTVDFNAGVDMQEMCDINTLDRALASLEETHVGLIMVAQSDPAGTLPVETKFNDRFARAGSRVGLGMFMNETLNQCDLVLPVHHSLESWGDLVSCRSVFSIMQPALEPIHDTRAEGDIYLELLRRIPGTAPEPDFRTYLFAQWNRMFPAPEVQSLVEEGFLSLDVEPVTIRHGSNPLAGLPESWTPPGPQQLLAVVPSIRGFDGRSRSLPMLNEIPDPLSTVTYGDYLSVSPGLAESKGLKNGTEIALTSPSLTTRLPALIQPELPDHVVMVHQGMIPSKHLRHDPDTGDLVRLIPDITLVPTGNLLRLPVMSGSKSQQGRGIIPHPVKPAQHHHYTDVAGLYDDPDYTQYRWAMAVDLTRCTGCSACVAACSVENNIPEVGVEEHLKGREMSWLRIEPYTEDFGTTLLPMLCQHCDYAPCEPVCPVFAAYHNPEGLNAQIYNRCVGTRYCANNCPYKVRRFNWSDHPRPEPMDRMLNPELLARGRGVMEKCTFCIQRIRQAKDLARDENRPVKDGEVIPACAQTCPSDAIIFGNLLDPDSEIYHFVHTSDHFRVLEQLGIEPAVYYKPKFRSLHGKKHHA